MSCARPPRAAAAQQASGEADRSRCRAPGLLPASHLAALHAPTRVGGGTQSGEPHRRHIHTHLPSSRWDTVWSSEACASHCVFLPASADDGGACCRAGTWEAKAEEPEQSEASFEVSTLLWLWLEGRRLCPIRLWETLTTWIELNFALLCKLYLASRFQAGWLFFFF